MNKVNVKRISSEWSMNTELVPKKSRVTVEMVLCVAILYVTQPWTALL